MAFVGSRRVHWAALAAVAMLAALCAAAPGAATLRVLVRDTPNKTESNRTAKTIDRIVIHDTEGRFIGSVRFLQRSRTRGSAHFVVSRQGQIVQLVPVGDVAWHAGNSWWNLHGIGIEHEGWAGRGRYTVAQYRASAQLVAYLAHRWGVPLDRRHIVGHNEVPNPQHPGRFGGASGHTDPGRWWNWRGYMWLVRYYAEHPVLPHFVKQMRLHDSPAPPPRAATRAASRAGAVRRGPARAVVDRRAALRGRALWWSGVDASRRWRRHIYKVDFLVDGRTLYTDHTWPYSFHRTEGWDSRTVANGRHMLTVLAYGTHRYRARKRIPVRVVNPPLRLALTGAVSGGAVSGRLTIGVGVREQIERVALYVDGRAVSRDSAPPYTVHWDTTTAGEGAHSLLVYARAKHGRRVARRVPVVVANAPTFPPSLASNWTAHQSTPDL
jgi:N-acetyl-anhydromuramyl-L-alanine amidase AmpD